jgi:hypothetical protein
LSSTEVGDVVAEIPESDSQIDEEFLCVAFVGEKRLEEGEVGDGGFSVVAIIAVPSDGAISSCFSGADTAGVAGVIAMIGAGFV